MAKKLIRHGVILAEILKECTEEFRDYDVAYIERHCIVGDIQVSKVAVDQDVLDADVTVLGANTEDASHDDGKAIFDFVFDAQVPDTGEVIRLVINLEVQVVANPGYPLITRAIYYLCRLISRQKGTVFQKDEYDKIRKAYSIWICPDPKKANRNSLAEYGFMQQKAVGHVDEPCKNYDKMRAIIISLNDDGMDESTGIIKLLSALLSTTETVEKRRKIVEEEFGIPLSYEITER